MAKIIIITEKNSMANHMQNALVELNNIEIIGINGHAFTEDETIIADSLNLDTPNWKNSSILVKEYFEDVYILGEKETGHVQKTIDIINDMINTEHRVVLVNACDIDKNGDYLFQYVLKALDEKEKIEKIMRARFSDFTQEKIKSVFYSIFAEV